MHTSISVIVVDDFPLMRTALAHALDEDDRISVIASCTDARNLLDELVLRTPDVILLDLQLPDLHGPELVERIRRLHPVPRILACTASERTATVSAVLNAGAAGYAVKRQTASEIADAVVSVHDGNHFVAPQVTAALLRCNVAPDSNTGAPILQCLADIELEILRLLVAGATDDMIARSLYVSPRTIQNRLTRIRRFAGVSRRTELTRWAVENRLA
ncbi:MAG: two component transcriptional regulator, LuxR family [Thermoleophilia bacterium]|nr:two component transcriptional regulator, LuxR family [Thermoleophilia bacterium]